MKNLTPNPELAVATVNPNAVAPVAAATETERMFSMIERMATDPNVDPAKLREILSVKQQWEADESRKAFAAGMAKFQSLCPIIEKLDTANGRGYARLDRIHREIRPLLRECGLWFSWTVCEEREGGLIYLEGLLGHASGHSVPCRQLISLPDKISGTNAAQRAGSGQTYAKRYGELAALNVVTGNDDDGNSNRQRPTGPQAPNPKPLPASQPEPAKPETGGEKVTLAAIWNLCKKHDASLVAGNTWDVINDWLQSSGVLADCEVLPKLPTARLVEVLTATDKLLNP